MSEETMTRSRLLLSASPFYLGSIPDEPEKQTVAETACKMQTGYKKYSKLFFGVCTTIYIHSLCSNEANEILPAVLNSL